LLAQLSEGQTLEEVVGYNVTSMMLMRMRAAWMASVGHDEYNVDEDGVEDDTGSKDNCK